MSDNERFGRVANRRGEDVLVELLEGGGILLEGTGGDMDQIMSFDERGTRELLVVLQRAVAKFDRDELKREIVEQVQEEMAKRYTDSINAFLERSLEGGSSGPGGTGS